MTWPDVKARIDAGADTVVFGVGSTEQHGPSLPLMTDRRIADYVAGMIAENLENTLQAPTIRVGCSDHHLGFPGSLSLREETLKAVIADYVRSIVRHGFKRIVITNHHGGNCRAVEGVIEELKQQYPDIRFVYFYDQETTEALGRLCQAFQLTPGQLGTHAGDLEASIMMALEADLVEKERLVEGYSSELTPEVREKAHSQGFESVTATGVMGDQRLATKEKGEAYIAALKEVVLGYVSRKLNEE